jgi:Uma2 family endonuclease
MATADLPRDATLADLLERIGDVPPARVRLNPSPGKATEKDLLRLQRRTDRLYELVEGVLVEKTYGLLESHLAVVVGASLSEQADELGMVLGTNAPFRLGPGLIRMPDVSFTSWDRFPGRAVPNVEIGDFAPDLAVEVLSPDNTRGELALKLTEYFRAGVRLVWYVDPTPRTVTVFTAPDRSLVLTEGKSLDVGDVLPGFRLPLRRLFHQVSRIPS